MRLRWLPLTLLLTGLSCSIGCGSTDDDGLNFEILLVGDDGNLVPAPSPAAIFADTNRDGRVELDDSTDGGDKTTWNAERGAIFLANIDDDENRCRRRGSNEALAECHDAADEVVNGADDLADLARVKTRPWEQAPDDAVGRLGINDSARERVRIFLNVGRSESPQSFIAFDPDTDQIGAEDLRLGVEFAIEGKDVIRDQDAWDGTLELTWTIGVAARGTEHRDTVVLRQAPVILRHQLDAAQKVYASFTDEDGNAPFLADLREAVTQARIDSPLQTFDVWDQWTQDLFENGYMAMPGPDGIQLIQVYVRSANIEYPASLEPLFELIAQLTDYPHEPALREGGRVVYTELRGPGVAGLTQYHPEKGQEPYDLTGYDLVDVVHYIYGTGRNRQSYPALAQHLEYVWERDTLDSFGNTETIPPHTYGEHHYPLGRIMRGGKPNVMPDPSMSRLFESQGLQQPLYIDTSWLVVSHIDETVSFLRSNAPRGWSMLVNDPTLAREMLSAQRAAGRGDTPMFVGKYLPVDPDDCTVVGGRWRCPDPVSATVTIDEVLDDVDIMAASARAAIEVDAQLAVFEEVVGITGEDIIAAPFLHEEIWGKLVAYQPGTVNGISLTPNLFGAPDPHGPVIDGRDLFKVQLETALGEVGIGVTFIENWDHYHTLLGEVHCGSNVRRAVDQSNPWWEVSP
jgi:protein-arginine deiminase